MENEKFFDTEKVKNGTDRNFTIPKNMIHIDRPATIEEKTIALLQMERNKLLEKLIEIDAKIQTEENKIVRQSFHN